MTKQIKFEGQIHQFPDDVTEDEINQALGGIVSPEQPPEQSFGQKFLRNIGAGMARGATGLANIPYDLAKRGEQPQVLATYDRKLMDALGEHPRTLPQGFAEKIPHFNEENDYSKMLGITGEPTMSDKAIQFVSEFALPVGGAAKLGEKGLMAAAKKLSRLPITKNMATKSLKEAQALSDTRNAHPGPLPDEIISDARQFFPNTAPYRRLIENALSGEYRPVFEMQSDLWKEANALKNPFKSFGTYRHGQAAEEVRDRMLEAFRKQLTEKGHGDIAKLKQQGQKEYRQYQKFKKLRNGLLLAGAGTIGLKPGLKLINALKSD